VNQLDGLRRYIEAATTLTSITRARAEELVRDLVASGELERGRAQDWIEDLVKRSREASEALVSTVSSEVDRQLGERGLKNFDLDDLAQRVAAIITMAGNAGRTATSRSRHESEDGAATKKTPSAKSASAKSNKSSARKSSTKKKDGGKGAKKTESKKVSPLNPTDQTSGTAT
jgi:polyhydroxyalkanoate synthesis regulator phasin